MSSWFVLNLGDALLADTLLDKIKDAFELELTSGRLQNKDDALYFRHESEGRLHCEVKVYFSPGCQHLAKHFNATVCQPPIRTGLALLAGTGDHSA